MTKPSPLVLAAMKEFDELECTGYRCRHETSEKHYLVDESYIKSQLQHIEQEAENGVSQKIDEKAFSKALKNFRRLRLIDHTPLKDEAPPSETTIAVLKRGLGGHYSEKAVEFIFRKAIRYYLSSLTNQQ